MKDHLNYLRAGGRITQQMWNNATPARKKTMSRAGQIFCAEQAVIAARAAQDGSGLIATPLSAADVLIQLAKDNLA